MKYIIQGAHITNVYETTVSKNSEGVSIRKPSFSPRSVYEWENILEFECDRLEYNASLGSLFGLMLNNEINISENESVKIKEKIFRADQGVVYLQSNKVLSERDDKETNQADYQKALKEYYDYVIANNPKVAEYLKIHEVKDVLENINNIKEMVNSNKVHYTSTNDTFSGNLHISCGTFASVTGGSTSYESC